MATGITMRTGWAMRSKINSVIEFPSLLRTEVNNSPRKNWAWQNFWWGTNFSITAHTKTISDSIGLTNIAF